MHDPDKNTPDAKLHMYCVTDNDKKVNNFF